MKDSLNSKLVGNVLSDGSFIYHQLFCYDSQQHIKYKNFYIFNHAVWTGKRPDKQTEIFSFINRVKKVCLNNVTDNIRGNKYTNYGKF
uniref:Ribosomal protein L31 n=1 Tax=Pleurocladia lacustris TaxID=246121 RepID=A0A1I9LWB2_9PHAE|nr:ribosomal protein L31 [Pleurocladia lacustris]